MTRVLNAIDLCCGAGGWAVAARGLPIRFVAVADLAEDCLETWRVNHRDSHPDCRLACCDLSTEAGRQILMSQFRHMIPDGLPIDLVLGGIPCEQVSVARYNTPASAEVMADWHRLVDSCLAIIKELDPRWWSLEDVCQIEAHLPMELQYGRAIPRRRIEASRYGPQRRKRTFLGKFPALADPEPGPRILRDVLGPGPYLTIPHVEAMKRSRRQYYAKGLIRVWDLDKPGFCVLDFSMRRRRACMLPMPDGRLRQLTMLEGARLQGFPDDFIFAAGMDRAWKMIAQAIPIYVGRAILKAICQEAGQGE